MKFHFQLLTSRSWRLKFRIHSRPPLQTPNTDFYGKRGTTRQNFGNWKLPEGRPRYARAVICASNGLRYATRELCNAKAVLHASNGPKYDKSEPWKLRAMSEQPSIFLSAGHRAAPWGLPGALRSSSEPFGAPWVSHRAATGKPFGALPGRPLGDHQGGATRKGE